MAETKISDADREDAFGVLHWLLTEYQGTLHAVALKAAEDDAMQFAVIANAARAWREACTHLADACETKQGSTASEHGGEVFAR